MFDEAEGKFQVYFLKQSDYIKIGVTQSIGKRMRHYETHSPHTVEQIATFTYDNKFRMQEAERWFHSLFWRYHHRGEWFWYKPIINWLYSTEEEKIWFVFKRIMENDKLDIYDDSFCIIWPHCGYKFWGDVDQGLFINDDYATDEQRKRFLQEAKRAM